MQAQDASASMREADAQMQRADALDAKCTQFTNALMRAMSLIDELLRENARLCAASGDPPSVRLFAAKASFDVAMHKLLGDGDQATTTADTTEVTTSSDNLNRRRSQMKHLVFPEASTGRQDPRVQPMGWLPMPCSRKPPRTTPAPRASWRRRKNSRRTASSTRLRTLRLLRQAAEMFSPTAGTSGLPLRVHFAAGHPDALDVIVAAAEKAGQGRLAGLRGRCPSRNPGRGPREGPPRNAAKAPQEEAKAAEEELKAQTPRSKREGQGQTQEGPRETPSRALAPAQGFARPRGEGCQSARGARAVHEERQRGSPPRQQVPQADQVQS